MVARVFPEVRDVEWLSAEELRFFASRRQCLNEETEDIEALRSAARMAAVARLPAATLRSIVILGGGQGGAAILKEDVEASVVELPEMRVRAIDAIRRLREAERRRFRNGRAGLNEGIREQQRFDETFHDAKLGFSIALVRGPDGLVIEVSRMDDDLLKTPTRLFVGDKLVAVNGACFDPCVDNPECFVDLVVHRLLRAPRPLTLTFAVGNGREIKPSGTSPRPRRNSGSRMGFLHTLGSLGASPQGPARPKRGLTETLRICVLRGEDLVAKDRNILGAKTASDPYAVVYVNNVRVGQTKHMNQTLSPEWNDVFEAVVDVSKPVPVKLQLFDYDMSSADDPMGEVTLDATKESEVAWKNMDSDSFSRWFNVRPTRKCKNATGRVRLALFIRQRPPPMPAGHFREVDARWAVRVHAARGLRYA